MDQSPKARFLRAKYIALERERQWYWRVYIGLKTCCLSKKDNKLNDTKNLDENIFINSPNISIPRLVEIERTQGVYGEEGKEAEAIRRLVEVECNEAEAIRRLVEVECNEAEAIRRLVEVECNEAIRHMVGIHHEIAMNRLREQRYADEVKNQENVKRMVQLEQEEQTKQDCKPAWARRRYYYNTTSCDMGPKFGEEERLSNYEPSSGSHLEQGFKPWARRRHYYNQAQYEESAFSNSTHKELLPSNPQDTSAHWARRRHYFKQEAIIDDAFTQEYKPWARRRHYYNEAGNPVGSDVRATQ